MSGSKLPDASRLSVLVVEDNEVNQRVTEAMLKHFGVSSDIAANGQIAIEMAAKKKYDLILMDCQMPVKSGYDAARGIRECNGDREHFVTDKKVPIIAMTANASPDTLETCLRSGMNDLIEKPVELSLIEKKIQQWIYGEDSDHSAKQGGWGMNNTSFEYRALDEEMVAELHSLMGNEFMNVYTLFMQSSKEQLSKLEKAIHTADPLAISKVSHALKGSSANIGAMPFSGLCEQFIQSNETSDTKQLEQLYAQLMAEYERLIVEIKSL